MRAFRIQPASVVDGVVNGQVTMKRLYPFCVLSNGLVLEQRIWQGDPLAFVGFAADPDRYEIDVTWDKFLLDPQTAINQYPVTSDNNGDWATLMTRIESITAIEIEE